MSQDADRMTRAGNYVLGLMDAEERERAERDMERDGDFRDAVVRIAERMHLFDLPEKAGPASGEMWQAIAARIAEMPQMRPLPADSAPIRPRMEAVRHTGLGAVGGWRGVLAAAVLIATFAAGYAVGKL